MSFCRNNQLVDTMMELPAQQRLDFLIKKILRFSVHSLVLQYKFLQSCDQQVIKSVVRITKNNFSIDHQDQRIKMNWSDFVRFKMLI